MFFPLCFKIAESFENLDNILHVWAKTKYKKSTVEAFNRYEKHSLVGKRKIKLFPSQKMAQKKFSSSPQSSETKPNTKLDLVSCEPLLSKPNKQNVYEIDLFNKFNLTQ